MKRHSSTITTMLLAVFLSACTTSTATPIPTTPTPKASPIPQINYADILFKQPNEWPAEIHTQHDKVLTDPWHATEAEKAAYDDLIINGWRSILKADGVPNAETLTGYELLDAIITYELKQPIGAIESQSEQLAHLVYLPFSMHKLLLTDRNNLIPYHWEESRGETYGIGLNTSPIPDHNVLVSDLDIYPDFSFYGTPIKANASWDMFTGELVFLFHIPGIDPNVAIGGMVRMYEGDKIGYLQMVVPLSSNLTSKTGDRCLNVKKGEKLYGKPCPAGMLLDQVILRNFPTTKEVPGDLAHLLQIMAFDPAPMIESGISPSDLTWVDAMPSVESIRFRSTTVPDFFK